eukprot:4126314-Prymnesium_polylepis.1
MARPLPDGAPPSLLWAGRARRCAPSGISSSRWSSRRLSSRSRSSRCQISVGHPSLRWHAPPFDGTPLPQMAHSSLLGTPLPQMARASLRWHTPSLIWHPCLIWQAAWQKVNQRQLQGSARDATLAHLGKLPFEQQLLVKMGSCLGGEVEYQLLADIYPGPQRKLHAAL